LVLLRRSEQCVSSTTRVRTGSAITSPQRHAGGRRPQPSQRGGVSVAVRASPARWRARLTALNTQAGKYSVARFCPSLRIFLVAMSFFTGRLSSLVGTLRALPMGSMRSPG
jgi:hypothetical protein